MKAVVLVAALVMVWPVPLGQASVIPPVTVLLLMAVENVTVKGAATAPEMPVVPVVAIVALAPLLAVVPVTEDTVGVVVIVANVNVTLAAIAVPLIFWAPVVIVKTQVASVGMELLGVTVNAYFPDEAMVTVWLVELQLSVMVLVVMVAVSMGVENDTANAAAIGISVVPVVPMGVPVVVVNVETVGATITPPVVESGLAPQWDRTADIMMVASP